MRFKSIGPLVPTAMLVLILAACGQEVDDPSIDPQMVVPQPGLELSKELVVTRSQSFEPRVTDKSAVNAEVDVTSGTAELRYTMIVEDVLVSESDAATVSGLTIENTGATALTVDITDTLYCGDGSGNVDADGALSIAVHDASDVAIAAGASHVVTGPFGPYDVGACPAFDGGVTKDVVNRLVVRDAATDAVLAQADLLPTARQASSSTSAAFLVDEEQLPDGYAITDASLVLDGVNVAFTGTADGDVYTIVTDAAAAAGTYSLRKTLVRNAGVECAPDLEVLNSAYMSSDGTASGMFGSAATATIDLLCTPPPPPGGGEGCTPGFWKNWTGMPPGGQPNAWGATGYHWSDPFTSAGFVDAFRGMTFLEVLEKNGGGKNALGRHAVAALLNAAHPDVSYDLTVTEIVTMFNEVVEDNGDLSALKNEFQGFNEQGCPLSQAVY